MTFSTTARMSLILFWAEVEEDGDENSIFPALMKMESDEEEEEEESLFLGLMKMELNKEE